MDEEMRIVEELEDWRPVGAVESDSPTKAWRYIAKFKRLEKICVVEFTISSRGGLIQVWHPFENRGLIHNLARESHCSYRDMRSSLRSPCPYLNGKEMFIESECDFKQAAFGSDGVTAVIVTWGQIWQGEADAGFWRRLVTYARRQVSATAT